MTDPADLIKRAAVQMRAADNEFLAAVADLIEPLQWGDANNTTVLNAAEVARRFLEGTAQVRRHPALDLPQPKGYKCPACQHDTFVHREGGCDVGDCDCPAPYGRIMPGI